MTKAPLDILVELTWALAGELPLETALQQVVDTALQLLPGAQQASVRLINDSGDALVASAHSGEAADEPTTFRPGEGIAGWVCETGRSAILPAADDPRVGEGERAASLKSLIAVPMMANGRVVGVLAATSAKVDAFDRCHEGILRLLASCTTPLIDKARIWRASTTPLEYALGSPLRLRLTAELVEMGELGLSLEDAVVRSGRHRQDVEACLRPMVRWMVVEFDGKRYRLCRGLPKEVRDTIDDVIAAGADQLGRERHVRHHLLGGMIGLDPKMQMVFEQARSVARLDVPVLLTGETGTGKELVARAVHDISPRRKCFFGAVNCATLSETLFESQVFGHVRGAFTGAVQDFVGLVERCDQGTLFLDEVGDLSLGNQVKLLRFLQEGTFSRLGETKVRGSDYRLVSATNRDLEAMVADGSFREDLYYRLAVFPIRLPSLRERKGDLKYLVEGILAVQAQRFRTGDGPPIITPEAVAQLERYNWPGNVRELENVMARAAVMAGGGPIGPEHLTEVELLSDAPPDSSPARDSAEFFVQRTLEDVQRDHIGGVLRRQRGNIKATAQILGISRTTLYKKIRDFNISAPV